MPASAGRACPTGPAPREVLLLVQAIDGCCYPLRCESATVGNRIVLGSIAELNANARQQLHNDLLTHGEPMKVTRACSVCPQCIRAPRAPIRNPHLRLGCELLRQRACACCRTQQCRLLHGGRHALTLVRFPLVGVQILESTISAPNASMEVLLKFGPLDIPITATGSVLLLAFQFNTVFEGYPYIPYPLRSASSLCVCAATL